VGGRAAEVGAGHLNSTCGGASSIPDSHSRRLPRTKPFGGAYGRGPASHRTPTRHADCRPNRDAPLKPPSPAGPGILAAALLGYLDEQHGRANPDEASQHALMTMLYVGAFLDRRGLETMASEQARHAVPGRFAPAVSIGESLASRDHILSMIDGRPYRTLSRHIRAFGLTPASYRRCFNLPDDYPLVAPAYSERRRALWIAQHALRA